MTAKSSGLGREPPPQADIPPARLTVRTDCSIAGMNPVGMLFPLSLRLLRPALVRGGSAFKDVPARARKNERRRSNKPAQAPYGSNRPGAIAMTRKSSSAAVGRRSATMCSMLPGRAERRVFKLRLQRKRIHSRKRPQASRKENLHRTISGIPAGNAGQVSTDKSQQPHAPECRVPPRHLSRKAATKVHRMQASAGASGWAPYATRLRGRPAAMTGNEQASHGKPDQQRPSENGSHRRGCCWRNNCSIMLLDYAAFRSSFLRHTGLRHPFAAIRFHIVADGGRDRLPSRRCMTAAMARCSRYPSPRRTLSVGFRSRIPSKQTFSIFIKSASCVSSTIR